MLLAGRVRKPEEEAVILSILGKNFKRTVNPEELFSQKQLTNQFSECRRRHSALIVCFAQKFCSSIIQEDHQRRRSSDEKMKKTKRGPKNFGLHTPRPAHLLIQSNISPFVFHPECATLK